MPTVASIPSQNPAELRAKWQTLRRADPRLRMHDAAQRLGVSEAELLATGCGENVTRLKGDFGPLIHALPRLGPVLPTAAQKKLDGAMAGAGRPGAGRGMQGMHDFHHVLEAFAAGRVQAPRLAERALVFAVPASSFAAVLERVSETETPVTVLVGNRGAVQIHSGPVRSLQRTEPWLEVLDENFSLHLREHRIASAWVMRQPSTEGVVTSLELATKRASPSSFCSGHESRGRSTRNPGAAFWPNSPLWICLHRSARPEVSGNERLLHSFRFGRASVLPLRALKSNKSTSTAPIRIARVAWKSRKAPIL